jgi:predicted metal-binding membrane protein
LITLRHLTATVSPPGIAAAGGNERSLVAWTLGAAAAAWLVLVVAASTPAGSLLHHHAPSTSAGAIAPAVFALGWLVMVAAMMLVPSIEFVRCLGRLLTARRRAALLLVTGMAAFALVWLLVGLLFQVGDSAVHALSDSWPWLEQHTAFITAGALALAGVYQLTPLKLRCLRACRNPVGFVARGWRGRSPAREVAQIGASYAWSCVGCCWALMLLMFAAGLTSIWLMAALTVVTVGERYVQRSQLAVALLSGTLLLCAALVATGVLTPFAAG